MITTQQIIAQCTKYMYSFYPYLPVKYKATEKQWKIRQFVWGFKDGKNSSQVAKMVAERLITAFGTGAKDLVFCCIPASSKAKTEIRYKAFSDEVCRLTGATNAYPFVTVSGEKLSLHETKRGKRVSSMEVIEVDEKFFGQKRVIVFDDVLTKGITYGRFAQYLENLGATVVGGMFLAKTIEQ